MLPQVKPMPGTLAFDNERSLEINHARQEALRPVLREVDSALGLRTALDVGCGVGHFSRFLAELGYQVAGMDAREENVAEAARRLPQIEFHLADIEDISIRGTGQSDFVLCFGLLYHLENPLLALRNLSALTRKALFIESLAVPGSKPILLLTRETNDDDQSLTTIAFYASEPCLVQMCEAAGFRFVYRFRDLPQHEEFRAGLLRKRRRSMLAASHAPLDVPSLVQVSRGIVPADPWRRPVYDLFTRVRSRIGGVFVRKIAAQRSSLMR